jgi:hypothetical protein
MSWGIELWVSEGLGPRAAGEGAGARAAFPRGLGRGRRPGCPGGGDGAPGLGPRGLGKRRGSQCFSVALARAGDVSQFAFWRLEKLVCVLAGLRRGRGSGHPGGPRKARRSGSPAA